MPDDPTEPPSLDPGPFEGWPEEPPTDTFHGVEAPPDSATGGDAAFGCFLQVLVAILLGVVPAFALVSTGDAPGFGEVAPTSSTSTSTSSSTTSSSTTTTTLPAVEEYSLQITYSGSCEGQNSAFFARIRDGSTIELVSGAPGSTGTVLATSTVGPPGRSFAFDGVGGSSLTMQGSIDGDTLAGTGSWSDLGPDCTFTLAGARV